MDILIEVLIISIVSVLIMLSMCYMLFKVKDYRYYVKNTKRGKYSHATFDDFLKEFNDKDMRNRKFYNNGFECFGDGYSSRCDCRLGYSIVFDNVCMLLNFKDYRKYVRFIKKEIKNRDLREIENGKVRKWGK